MQPMPVGFFNLFDRIVELFLAGASGAPSFMSAISPTMVSQGDLFVSSESKRKRFPIGFAPGQ
jgi:hypothetical protein